MPLAFLTPLFIGGLALLVAPWLIHQIRRPEREPLRFSSLMFIPQTRKEVIERRRIQHILLMLIRMAMLAFLAFAFARPYWRTPATAAIAGPGATTWHAVVLDSSYSMGTGGWFEDAKKKALSIVDSLGPTDRVGVITFSRGSRTVAPVFSETDTEAGAPSTARMAIESAQLTEDATDYVPALQAVQSMFAAAESQSGSPPAHFVAHLVSDFQRAGMPDRSNRWKLEPRIELRCVAVGGPDNANCAIEDVSVRETGEGELRVRGKVRNWSSAEVSRAVTVFAQGREQERSTLTLAPGAARQVSFRIPIRSASSLEGRIELEDDPLKVDNRRYFAWQEAGKQRVMLLSSKDANRRRPAARFLASALSPENDLPWLLEVQSPDVAKDILPDDDQRPSILIVADLESLTPPISESIRRYVETGGRVLLTIDCAAASGVLNDGLLGHWGARSEGPRHSEKRESRFALLSWVDFDHPVFFPLRGAQFNDFSSVRFYNHHRLSILKQGANAEAEQNPRVIARFEPNADGDETPAAIEARVGDGRVVIWAFGMDLEWSNLPRSVKFIPLLYETLTHLGGGAEDRRSWLVGDSLRPPKGAGIERDLRTVQLPGETDKTDLKAPGSAASEVITRKSGFVRWHGARNMQSEFVEAVNLRARESAPERISAEEFLLKLSAPRVEPRQTTPLDLERGVVVGGFVIHREYWRLLVGLLFAFFFLESWHAAAKLG